MNKKLIGFFIVTLVVTLLVDIFAGGWIGAKLATIPIIEKYHILNPQAPIVITRREEVRSNQPTDLQDAVNKTRSRLSTVATIGGGTITVNGAAINLSADGYFLTVLSALGKDPTKQSIILDNGQSAPIIEVSGEPGTNLVVVKAGLNKVAAAEFGSSIDGAAGQGVAFAHTTGINSSEVYFQQTHITNSQIATGDRIFSADKPARAFGVQAVGSLLPGEAIVNLDGKIMGLWDGTQVVSSDVINETVRLYFNSASHQVQRPQWRFTYRNIGSVESGLFAIPIGAWVAAVEPGGPAANAGLKAGDSITAVAGEQVTAETQLEELLQRHKPGEQIGLTVVRDKKLMTLSVTPL